MVHVARKSERTTRYTVFDLSFCTGLANKCVHPRTQGAIAGALFFVLRSALRTLALHLGGKIKQGASFAQQQPQHFRTKNALRNARPLAELP